MRRRDKYPALWEDLKYMAGSRLRRRPKGDDSGWNPQLQWLLKEQMGVSDIHRHIYLSDLLTSKSMEVIDDMENKLLHYANKASHEVTARRMVDFYRTLPDRLEDDAKIYGVAGMSDGRKTMGKGL